jgi:hypothetical protein
MGAYLSQPVTAKDSSDGASDAYAYGTTAMQGWRTNMEVGDDGRPPRCVFFFLFFRPSFFLRRATNRRRNDEGSGVHAFGTSSQHSVFWVSPGLID